MFGVCQGNRMNTNVWTLEYSGPVISDSESKVIMDRVLFQLDE